MKKSSGSRALSRTAEGASMLSSAQTFTITNPLIHDTLKVPNSVRVSDDFIDWRYEDEWRDGLPPSGVLWQFLALGKETRLEAYADFIRNYGVLGIGSDGDPGMRSGHFPASVHDSDGSTWRREELFLWRTYAENARTVVALAAELRLRRGPIVNFEEIITKHNLVRSTNELIGAKSFYERNPWNGTDDQQQTMLAAMGISPESPIYNLGASSDDEGSLEGKSRDEQRGWLAFYVQNAWIEPACLVNRLIWKRNAPHMELVLGAGRPSAWPPNPLFSVIAAHLSAVLTSDDVEHIVACARCGKSLLLDRKPRSDRSTYCPDCRPLAQADRYRAFMQRKAAAACSHDCSQPDTL